MLFRSERDRETDRERKKNETGRWLGYYGRLITSHRGQNDPYVDSDDLE